MNGRVVTEMGEASVKESEKAYTMELAAPGIKKEYCRIAINDEGRSAQRDACPSKNADELTNWDGTKKKGLGW